MGASRSTISKLNRKSRSDAPYQITAEDYQATVSKMVSSSLPGGGIYDGLIAQAALKAGVDVLLTLNPNDFTRLGDDVRRLVQVPL